jgi:hypothetical protein
MKVKVNFFPSEAGARVVYLVIACEKAREEKN